MIDGFIVLYCSTDSRPPMRSYPYCYFTFNFIADSLVYLSGCNEDAMSRNKCHFFGLEFICTFHEWYSPPSSSCKLKHPCPMPFFSFFRGTKDGGKISDNRGSLNVNANTHKAPNLINAGHTPNYSRHTRGSFGYMGMTALQHIGALYIVCMFQNYTVQSVLAKAGRSRT